MLQSGRLVGVWMSLGDASLVLAAFLFSCFGVGPTGWETVALASTRFEMQKSAANPGTDLRNKPCFAASDL